MDVPDIPHELVSEFAGITGASPLVADHYLSACNYDLNRAVEFYFEHPPAPSQAGPRAAHNFANEAAAAIDAIGNDGDVARQAFTQGNAGAGDRNIADEDEELQRALAASIADAGLGPAHSAELRPGAAEQVAQGHNEEANIVLDDEEELFGAEALLQEMARQRDEARAADRDARQRIEEMMDRMLGGIAGRPPGAAGIPQGLPLLPGRLGGGLPSMFPGLMGPLLHPTLTGGIEGVFSRSPPFGGPAGRSGRWRDEGGGGNSSGGNREGGGAGHPQRRRIEIQEGEGSGADRGAPAATAPAAAAVGPSDDPRLGGWGDDELELPEGISHTELEEARMMEAAMLGVPYEGRALRDYTAGPRAVGINLGDDRDVAPEVLEHRELRWDQDRAYEESLAADRAKEQAAARAKAIVEEQERAQREAEMAADRAAAEEAARLVSLLLAKARRLPAEPPSSSSDGITVMVRLPDGSRHSRRFAPTDRLSSLFDFVDVELDSTAKAAVAAAAGDASTTAQSVLKPGSYNLVAQFPRRVFLEDESGGKTFAEAGLAVGGGAAFFVEQKDGYRISPSSGI